MRVHELLTIYRKMFAMMTRQGLNIDDIMFLDMFKEYRTLTDTGQNKRSVSVYLAKKYKLSVQTVNRAITRLEEEYKT